MTLRDRRPIHPGEILAEDVLDELGLNANQVGEALGFPLIESRKFCVVGGALPQTPPYDWVGG